MKNVKLVCVLIALMFCVSIISAQTSREVSPLVQSQWHQTDPWNGRCPGNGANRANAGSHALALAKTMKYWAYPTYGTGNVSYVDDDYGTITASFTAEINWSGMSNTLPLITTTRFIATCGAAVYTNYEVDFSSSSLNNIRTAMINNFSYDAGIVMRNRENTTNFYWKSLIRGELDLNRPVIYTITLSDAREIAFIIDGYDDDGLFHINWSDATVTDGWFELNTLSFGGEAITTANQQMLTGIRPSLGPPNIDENFETDFSHFNWQFSGNANWTISTEAAYYGSKSAKTGNISDNQTTSLYIQINVTEPDTISFYKKVSCEYDSNNLYDHLAFFIDGVEQNRWSGNGSWAFHEYMVSAGIHEFRWSYIKDGATTSYSDCAWIDAINLPEGTTPLNPPRFVEAEVVNGRNVLLNWVAPEGVNLTLLGYKVYRNGTEVAQFSNPAMTSYTDANLPNGNYTYYLRSYYTEGISSPSASVNATIEVPYAPTNLTASLEGISTVNLSWTAPPAFRDRALMGYYVYRDDVQIGQVESPEVTTYQDSGLGEGVYYYKVAAVYASAVSAFSNTVQVAVGVAEPPSNLTVVVNGANVTLSWQQVSDTSSLVGFKVFRGGVMIAQITSPTQLNYTDANLLNGTYAYYVRAIYLDVESANSATVNATVEVKYPPTGVTATVTNGINVQLHWNNPQLSRALTSYIVYRNGSPIAMVFSPGLAYLDQSLPNGVYTYTVTAVYSGIESLPSAPVQATIEVLYPPTALTAVVTLVDVHLSWTVPVNSGGLNRSLLGYKVYRNSQLIGTINNTATHVYNDTNVPNGLYTYSVSAIYSAGESSLASVSNVLIELLYPPTTLQANVNGGNVALHWAAAATEPSGKAVNSRAFVTYNVYKDNLLLGQTTTTDFVDVNTVNGTYQYYVTALYDSGESEQSNHVSVFIEIPYPPTGLAAIVNSNAVALSWTAPSNRDAQRVLVGYQVYRNDNLINTITTTSYNDTNLANDAYSYYVKAVYENSVSVPTNTVSVNVEVLYPARNLQYTVTNRNNVNLNWIAPLQSGGLRNLVEYKVYRNNVYLATTSNLTYSDLALADGSYSYKINAVYTSGTAAAGNTVVATIQYPYPPTNVTSVVAGSNVTVSWNVVSGTNVSYRLYRNSTLLTTTTNLSYVDTNLNNGTYTYYVISFNSSDSGASDASAVTTATVNVPYPPRNLQAAVTGNAVSLTWLAPVTGTRAVQSYKVMRDGNQIANVNALSYTDSGLGNGSYVYTVKAVYESAESVASNAVTATVEVLYPASNLSYTVNTNNVNLSWAAAAVRSGERSFTGYRVFRNGSQIAMVTDLFYHDLNLANGNYTYYIVAAYGSGNSTPTNSVSLEIEILYPANNLTYTVNSGNVILSWTASTSRAFIGYAVYRDNVQIAQVTGLTYTDANRPNGNYSYYVKAVYQGGQSTATNTVNVIVETLYPASSLTAVVTGDDVALTWTAAATSGGLRNLLGYKVYRGATLVNQVTTTSYSDMNLANGLYQYSIVATYTSGDAMPTPTVQALVEVLYPASGLTYVVNANAVTLNWTAAPTMGRAFIGYKIYRNNALLTQTTNQTYVNLALANGVYTYYVKALYGTGESVATNTVTATIEVLYPASGLTASVTGDDVSLSWTAAATNGGLRNLLGYKIYRDGSLISQTTDLTYMDLNLANGTYSYRVSALYTTGESTLTTAASALVEVLYPATLLTFSVNADNVQLNWTAAVTSGGLRNFIGYKVYRNNTLLTQVSGLSYLDSGLSNGVYQYNVKAVYGTGESTPTNTVTATIEVLYPASNLTYSTNDDNVSLAWTAAPTSMAGRGFVGYKIYRNGTMITEVTSLNYTDQNLSNGAYQYYVTAHYASGESTPTNTVSLYLEVLYPATGLIANVTTDDVALIWTAAATSGGLRNLLGYKVYRDGALINQVTSTNYNDLNLANGIYQYSIVATYTSGDALPTSNTQALVEVLYPASGLSYVVNANAVTLNWTAAPTMGRAFVGYKIYRNNTLLNQTTDLTYVDLALANGVYTYYVKALYGTGESVASNNVTATVEVLYPATGLTASVTGDDVSLSWTAAATNGGLRNFLGYKIYRDNSVIFQTTNLNYTDLNLANGTYSYQVSALYTTGESTLTSAASAMVEVLYPATQLTYSVNAANVQLNWTAAATSGGLRNLLGYKIYRNSTLINQVNGATYTDTALSNGVYQYYVIAVYGTGESTPTNTISATVEVLYPPSGLAYSVVGDDVSLNWMAAPNSARSLLGYNVYRNGVQIAQVTGLVYDDLNLNNGIYQYTVRARYTAGESIDSAPVTVEIDIPYSVAVLSATVAEDAVTLHWNLPPVGVTRAFQGYFIYRNNALYQVLNDATATSWTDYGLANGTYSYWLVAVYDAGLSVASNTVEATVYVMPNLNPPTALSLFIVNDRFVTLDWTVPVGNVLSYKVYRNNVELANTATNTYYDPNLANGSYTYYVKALYAEGLSSASNTVIANIMIANAPTNFVATVQNDNDVAMSWTAPGNNETAFIIYRNGVELAFISDVQTTSYVDMNLSNGTYNYSVVAVYQNVISNPTAIQTVIINQTFSPTNVQLTVVQSDVTLTWVAPENLDQFVEYRIYRNGVNYTQTTGLTFTDTGLANGAYQYYLTTVYQTGESTPSAIRTANVRVAYAPSNLTATTTDTNVYLSWTASSDLGGFIAYQIWRNGTHIVDANATTYTDVNLPNGPQTYYLVAVYNFGTSSPSNSITINVVSAYSPQTAFATATNHNVLIQWTAPLYPANLTGYRLYKNDALLLETTALTYADNGLLNGDYHYKVSALYGAMESAANDAGIIHLETLYPPTNASLNITTNTVHLAWSGVQDMGFFQSYKVYRNNVLVTTTTDLTFTDTNLSNGSYGYQISAQYVNGESVLTNLLIAQIQLPYAPQSLNYQVAGNNVSLYWTAPVDLSGFSGYRLYRNGSVITQLNGTNYVDHNVPNEHYIYQVTAMYGTLESPFSASVDLNIAIQYPATNVIAIMNTTTHTATISWTEAAGGPTLTGYTVHFLIDGEQTNPGNWVTVATNIDAANVNDAIHGGLATGYFMWAVTAVYEGGTSEPAFSNVVHAVENEDLVGVYDTKLIGNYPNPFNPETQIVFSLKEKMQVKLLVYNVKGQLVNTLVNDRMNAGEHRIIWRGNDSTGKTLSSGVYFYHLITPNYNKVGKTLLTK